MATTLVLGVAKTITTGSANVLSEVIFPLNARSYSLRFATNAGKVLATGGTDGGALGSADTQAAPADATATWPVPGTSGKARNLDTRKAWFTSATGSTSFTITAYDVPYQSVG
jgi:hypothetical protein